MKRVRGKNLINDRYARSRIKFALKSNRRPFREQHQFRDW